jgi:predicted DNA-binding protein
MSRAKKAQAFGARVSTRLTGREREALDLLAQRTGRPVSRLLRDAIAALLVDVAPHNNASRRQTGGVSATSMKGTKCSLHSKVDIGNR